MDITYQGVELTIEGLRTEGRINGYFEEDIQSTYEVYSVSAGDLDITILLSIRQIEDIEFEILNNY
jgi:hypothetical protein